MKKAHVSENNQNCKFLVLFVLRNKYLTPFLSSIFPLPSTL